MVTPSEKKYTLQCPEGHVSVAETGSNLEERCIERSRNGDFGAMPITKKECPECCVAHHAAWVDDERWSDW